MDRRRYTRQIRLAEVGDAGQEKLLAAEVRPGASGFAREVESTYLGLAGVRVTEAGAREEVDVATLGLEHDAAREVGEGALRALAAIRAILGVR